MYGVGLKWNDEKHHFWAGDKTVTNTKDKEYYEPIFELYFNGVKKLLDDTHSEIMSVSKDSRLNSILRYTDVDGLIKRRTLNEDSNDYTSA
jgi:hypothetical protein